MKRDWDLIRDIMLKIEELPKNIGEKILVVDDFISEDYKLRDKLKKQA